MKNRKSIYILLPLVLFIWGAIAYQFFSFSNSDIPEIQNKDIAIKPLIIKPIDTFSITINKRDPFLGKMINNEIVTSSVKIKTSKKTPKVKVELIWPNVQYKGIVSDIKDKVKVYLVIIDGKSYLMKKGDIEEDVKLKDGDRETIYAIYKGDLKVVFIQ